MYRGYTSGLRWPSQTIRLHTQDTHRVWDVHHTQLDYIPRIHSGSAMAVTHKSATARLMINSLPTRLKLKLKIRIRFTLNENATSFKHLLRWAFYIHFWQKYNVMTKFHLISQGLLYWSSIPVFCLYNKLL